MSVFCECEKRGESNVYEDSNGNRRCGICNKIIKELNPEYVQETEEPDLE